jgi:DNA-binding CsgD family transcriptional regulator
LLPVDPQTLKVGMLTPKERECLRLVAENRSSKEIALELGISKASVDTYCNRARAKLGAPTRRAAARLAMATEPKAVPEAEAPKPAPPPAVHVSVLPPISRLGPLQRLGLIVAGAVVLALAFGMLMAGLQTLDRLVGRARAAAEAEFGQTAPASEASHPREDVRQEPTAKHPRNI